MSSPTGKLEDAANQHVLDIDVGVEMQNSYLEYAYSVIYARALPDARDGLKPVQRRILYTMRDMRLLPEGGHVKSARVVGDVMGKLHPHGDGAIYDALVRLAQPFTMRLPLVDGHGNFGSLDDGPAASRYTEARLAAAAVALTHDLDEDVVDFVPNYDNQLTQPEVLPAAIPNLLVNGASGIAVGMATSIPPHNLGEVVAAARHLIENPDATIDDLLRFVPGPDFPSGGTITTPDAAREAYETGRGAVRVRAEVHQEQLSARKVGLVVTELPYLVGPERILEKIKDGVQAKKLNGISDIADLTDRKNGLRLVIEVKSGFDPGAVLEQLYRLTPLEESTSINMVALVDGRPRTLGLREALEVYLRHRTSVVTRRSEFRLMRRRERLHLVDGLLVAIADIDEVIQVIRGSDDAEQARGRLRQVFDLSEKQADYILELRLRRLTKFSRIELETERAELMAEIEKLEALLGDPALLRGTVSAELEEVAQKFGTPRRTKIAGVAVATPGRPSAKASGRAPSSVAAGSASEAAVGSGGGPGVGSAGGAASTRAATSGGVRKNWAMQNSSLEHADTACVVVLGTTGLLYRVDGGQADGAPTMPSRANHDAARSVLGTTSRSEIGVVTSAGRLVRFTPVDLPSFPSGNVQPEAGVLASEYFEFGDAETAVALVSLAPGSPISVGTALGVVKRVAPGYPNRPEFPVIALKDDDTVVGAGHAGDADELVFISSDAQLLRLSASSVRPQGWQAGGMAGMALGEGAKVIAFQTVPQSSRDQAVVATVAASSSVLAGLARGAAKLSLFSEFPAKGRATGGVRVHRFLKGQDVLTVGWVGVPPVAAIDRDGTPRQFDSTPIRRDASGEVPSGHIESFGTLVG